MRVADTSFLYALFSESDVFHRRARRAAESPEPILLPSEIFSETVSLIHVRAGFVRARAAGNWIRAQGRITVSPTSRSLMDRAWGTYERAGGRLSWPDSIVLAWCWQAGAAPLSFHEALVRRWRERSTEHRQRS